MYVYSDSTGMACLMEYRRLLDIIVHNHVADGPLMPHHVGIGDELDLRELFHIMDG